MLKPSRRAAVIAASFALGLSAVGPTAHAGLLGGSDSDSTAIEGVGLPVGGDLLGGDLLGGLLGGGVLGGDLLGSVLGGGGLPVVGALGGGGLPLVGDVLGGEGGLGGELLGGELLGGELLNVVTDTTLHCDAAIPQVLWALLGERHRGGLRSVQRRPARSPRLPVVPPPHAMRVGEHGAGPHRRVLGQPASNEKRRPSA